MAPPWRWASAAATAAAAAAAAATAAAHCTTMIVSPGASADGSVLTSSTSDCKDCDFRLAFVAARTYNGGDSPPPRPVYEAKFNFPHLVTEGRSPTWEPENLKPEGLPQVAEWLPHTKPIGSVPGVNATAALYETGSGYALLNEHQLAMGESSCPAMFVAKPVSDGGKALLDVSELSRLAMERTRTARDAIALMGALAEKYGYYGAEWDNEETKFDEAGEALMVGDTTEAWVFHILPDDSGASAIWAAQRVPDGHMTVVANNFVIRGVNTSDGDHFMFSDSVYEVAKRLNLWDGKGLLDFTKVYGQARSAAHSSYATRRVWRVFMLADPGLDLPSHTDELMSDYPFSVAPIKKVDLARMVSFQRDHYEGTEFDTTVGLAGGPYGDPDRYDPGPVGNMSSERANSGEFPRTISLFRTSYSYVARSSAALPSAVGAMLLFAPHAAGTSAYVPFYLAGETVPPAYATGSLFRFRGDVAYWAVALVTNWVHKYYIHAIGDVRALQAGLEADIRNGSLATFEANAAARLRKATKAKHVRAVTAALSDYTTSRAAATVAAYVDAFPALVAKFHDGFIRTGETEASVTMTTMFYPEWWLKAVGYFRAGDAARAEAAARAAGEDPAAAAAAALAADDAVVPVVLAPAPAGTGLSADSGSGTPPGGPVVTNGAGTGDDKASPGSGLWGGTSHLVLFVAGLVSGLGGGFLLAWWVGRLQRRSGYQEIGGS
ncbi:hypothetical protein MMPV_008939 [Pyropia vietnamensis]